MDEDLLGGVASLLGGWRLREFHDGRRGRARQGDLSRQLRASGDAQEPVRSDQPVSRQPEYQANGVSTVAYAREGGLEIISAASRGGQVCWCHVITRVAPAALWLLGGLRCSTPH